MHEIKIENLAVDGVELADDELAAISGGANWRSQTWERIGTRWEPDIDDGF